MTSAHLLYIAAPNTNESYAGATVKDNFICRFYKYRSFPHFILFANNMKKRCSALKNAVTNTHYLPTNEFPSSL